MRTAFSFKRFISLLMALAITVTGLIGVQPAKATPAELAVYYVSSIFSTSTGWNSYHLMEVNSYSASAPVDLGLIPMPIGASPNVSIRQVFVDDRYFYFEFENFFDMAATCGTSAFPANSMGIIRTNHDLSNLQVLDLTSILNAPGGCYRYGTTAWIYTRGHGLTAGPIMDIANGLVYYSANDPSTGLATIYSYDFSTQSQATLFTSTEPTGTAIIEALTASNGTLYFVENACCQVATFNGVTGEQNTSVLWRIPLAGSSHTPVSVGTIFDDQGLLPFASTYRHFINFTMANGNLYGLLDSYDSSVTTERSTFVEVNPQSAAMVWVSQAVTPSQNRWSSSIPHSISNRLVMRSVINPVISEITVSASSIVASTDVPYVGRNYPYALSTTYFPPGNIPASLIPAAPKPAPEVDFGSLKPVKEGTHEAEQVTGKNLSDYASVTVGGKPAALGSSSDTSVSFTPAGPLPAGRYDIVLNTAGGGSLTIQGGYVVEAPVEAGTEASQNQPPIYSSRGKAVSSEVISGFSKSAAALSQPQRSIVSNVVNQNEAVTLTCLAVTGLKVSLKLATKRANLACDYAQKLNPLLVTNVVVESRADYGSASAISSGVQPPVAPVILQYTRL